jgi:hypothetical protein
MADDIKNVALDFSCTEDFDKMPCVDKDGKQRHCSGCNKTVHDFTESTDTEMQEILQQNNGNVCGRFSLSQMSKNYLIAQAASLGITLSSLYACNEEYITHRKGRQITGVMICQPRPAHKLLGTPRKTNKYSYGFTTPIIVADTLVIDYLNTTDLTQHVINVCNNLANNKTLKVKLRINSKGEIYAVNIQSKNLTMKERQLMQQELLAKLKNVVAEDDCGTSVMVDVN